MSQMTNYLENGWGDHIFRTATFSKPTNLYLALYTVAPTDVAGGTEVSGGSYARVANNPSNTNWTATQGGTSGASSGTSGTFTNAVEITFPTPTANWGTIVAFGIFDASTGGNLLCWGSMTPNKTVNNGDVAPKFIAGSISVILA